MTGPTDEDPTRRAHRLSVVLADVVAAPVPDDDDEVGIAAWRERAGLREPYVAQAVLHAVRHVQATAPRLVGTEGKEARTRLRAALESPPLAYDRDLLWALLVPATGERPSRRRDPRVSRAVARKVPALLTRSLVGLALNLIIAAAVAVAVALHVLGGVDPGEASLQPGGVVLRVFAVWVLSFVPGWMFVRFIGHRAVALWDEYVVHLHRMRWDRPRNLPRPPRTSEYHEAWLRDGGEALSQHRSIYREKFDAYYGRSVSRSGESDDRRVRAETLFPVFLLTAVLAACWTATLWDVRTIDLPATGGSLNVWTAMAFAFLGVYSFGIQMLMRRFYQGDLRASAYAALTLRLIIVLVLVVPLQPLVARQDASAMAQAVVFYGVGFFPIVGLQALQRFLETFLKIAVRSLRSDYPLAELDGLSIWYEARLLEEGVEDLHNLARANLVDILLHTRVPAGRLVDWIDQAHLLLRMDRPNQTFRERYLPRDRYGTTMRAAFRCLGVRTATDLVTAFPPDELDDPRRMSRTTRDALEYLDSRHVDVATVRTMVRLIDADASLNPVRNWHRGDVELVRRVTRGNSARGAVPQQVDKTVITLGENGSQTTTRSAPRTPSKPPPKKPRRTPPKSGSQTAARTTPEAQPKGTPVADPPGPGSGADAETVRS